MRILYFHQHYTNPDGGGGTRSYEFAKRLIARGHQVTMICGRYANGVTGLEGNFVKGMRSGVVQGLTLIEFDLPYSNADTFLKRTFTFLRYSFRSIHIALTQKYDLIFATSTPLTAGIPGIFAKLLRKKTFVFEVRDLWPELPKAMGVIKNPLIIAGMSFLEWCSYRMADHCIGLAPGIIQGIQKRNVPSAQLSMIPNGCDTDLFAAVNPSLPSPVHWDKKDFVAIFAGAHGVANGLDAVLDVAVILKQKNCHHIKLLFVGEGKIKPALILRAKQEQLTNCIFLPNMPKYQLATLYKQVNVGMMILQNIPAFYFGTSPNKFFDYIACGLPVICNYPGWLAELIEQKQCGEVVSPEDAGVFAQRLVQLAADPARLKKMGENAFCLAKHSFNREQLAQQFVDVLECTATKGVK